MPDERRSDDREGRTDLDGAIRDLAGEDRRSLGDHPDPVALLDFQQGKLSEAATERLEEHLALCHDCAEAVLDFAAFPHLEPPDERLRMTPAQIEREKRRLRSRLDSERLPLWVRPPVLLPMAAAFIVAVIGLGIWGAGLRGRVAELEAPRGDVHNLGTLVPTDRGFRGEETSTVPPWASRVQFFLVAPHGEGRFDHYEVDVATEGESSVVAGLRVERSANNPFLVELSRRLLSVGSYRVSLFGVEDGRREPVAGYRLTVEAGPVEE